MMVITRSVTSGSAGSGDVLAARVPRFRAVTQGGTRLLALGGRASRCHLRSPSTAYLRSLEDSKAEAQSDRGINVVALEKAGGQSAIHLREHDPEIEIPLWCKPPIDSGRERVERPGALRVLGAGAGGGPPGGGAEVRI